MGIQNAIKNPAAFPEKIQEAWLNNERLGRIGQCLTPEGVQS